MQITNIIVHHSGGTDANPMQDSSNYTVQMCNNDHKKRFNMRSSMGWYVGYHYFIDKKGVLIQTRDDQEEGAHCVGYNNHPGDPVSKRSIGIHLSGNFDATDPTKAQVDTLTALLKRKLLEHKIDPKNIRPHRGFASKTCYGMRLKESWARDLVKPAPTQHVFTIYMKKGDEGGEVIALQKLLVKLGYLTMPKNVAFGYYGDLTVKAVLQFQRANGIKSGDGTKVGPLTIPKLNLVK